MESLWLNVYPHNSNRSILIGALYRPPSTDKGTDYKIEKNIEAAYLRNWEKILVGDVNVDYLNRKAYSKHHLMKSLKNVNMTQYVTVVTWPKSNSCLDHVHTTHRHFITNISVSCIGLSDHLPVFLCLKYVKLNLESGHKQINYLNFKNLNAEAMLSDLKDSPWDSAFVFDDVEDTLDALSEVVKKHIPKKLKRVKKTKQPAWIDENIVSAIKKRDRELKIARKTNCPNDWSKYKRTKCYVTNLVRNLSECIFNSLSMTTKETQKKFGRR